MPATRTVLQAVAACLAVDVQTANVTAAFEADGIDVVLVKGPVIGAWLYPGELRTYADSDLLVSTQSWDRAVALLVDMGFHDFLAPLGHPRMESEAGTGFARGAENVDLHSTLPGLTADRLAVWKRLHEDATTMMIGGRSVRVPGRAAVLMHIGLHAVHHLEGKPLEDLRRAVGVATPDEWRSAAELADDLGGLAAFATGLRLDPGGQRIAEEIGIGDAGSVLFDLRTADVPLVEGLHGLAVASSRERIGILARELFPNAAFMRWSRPLARRGRRGLAASYPLRWLWLAYRLPSAVVTLRRIRHARDG